VYDNAKQMALDYPLFGIGPGAGHLIGPDGLGGQQTGIIGCRSARVGESAGRKGETGFPSAVLEAEQRGVGVIHVAGELEDGSRREVGEAEGQALREL